MSEEDEDDDARWTELVESVAYHPRQLAVVNRILDGETLAILGGPGTGKSHIIKVATSLLMMKAVQDGKLRDRKPRSIQVVAPTGVAAVNVDGMTINRFVGMTPKYNTPPPRTPWRERGAYGGLVGDGGYRDWTVKLGKTPLLKMELQRLQTLIVDEISMVPADFVDLIDKMFREARGTPTLAFGGVQMVAVGDFRQLAPIPTFSPDDERFAPGTPQYAFYAEMWDVVFGDSHTVLLTENVRQSGDPRFAELLTRIGSGAALSDDDRLTLMDRTCVGEPGPEVLRLYGTREKVSGYNARCMNALASAEHRLSGVMRVCDGMGGVTEVEPGGMLDGGAVVEDIGVIEAKFDIERTIFLKEGCRVMLTTNVDMYRRQCNGSVGYFRGMDGDVFLFEMDGDGGSVARLERKAYKWGTGGVVGQKGWREYLQYPVRLAYALTVHKAQGVTVDRLYLGSDFGMFSQFFVAASRVRTLDGLILESFNPDWIKVDAHVIKYYRTKHGDLGAANQ